MKIKTCTRSLARLYLEAQENSVKQRDRERGSVKSTRACKRGVISNVTLVVFF